MTLLPLRSLAAFLAFISVPATAQMAARVADVAPAVAPQFRAPALPAPLLSSLAAPSQKVAAGAEEPAGRMRVGTVRPLPKALASATWHAADGGFVSRFTARSEGAEGLRVKLALNAVPGPMELRAQGRDGRIEVMPLDPYAGPEAWTPWTPGNTQLIEVFSAVEPSPGAVLVESLLHLDMSSPFAKAAGSCTISTSCSTGDPAIDIAMAERKKSVMRLAFVDGGSGYVCTGTLINTELFPAAYVLTASHCIDNAASAASLTTLWFYETLECNLPTVAPTQVQVSGGAQLVFSNYNVDSTLLRLNLPTPAGAVYAGWDPLRLAPGAPIVSISHPTGDTSRVALGAISREYRIVGRPQDMYGVRFASGIIQGGSSGSGLFTLSGGALLLRGILTGTTVRNEGGMSCTNLNEEALYSRFEVFEPQIKGYITASGRAADDAPNRFQDLASTPTGTPLEQLPEGLAFNGKRVDYVGDVDVYKFTIGATSWVTLYTDGPNIDTVGTLLDASGSALEAEDDAQRGDNHFGITRRLDPGVYYVQVTHWEADGTGPYNLKLQASTVDKNYTDLWWNDTESGWGINFNHQGNILFGTLFTYDRDGRPLWLVMSNGARQADGSFRGELYRTTGPAFNAVPFTGAAAIPVGTMSVAFPTLDTGTLTYTYEGTEVMKAIKRQAFATPPTCSWSGFDRSYASNYQDLWWKADESGWGVNIAHQGDKLFATLFTYGADGRPAWYAMTDSNRQLSGGITGVLYRFSGPAFDARPWRPVVPEVVGNMTLSFASGNQATLTYTINGVQVVKPIERQVFSMPKTQCES